MRGIIAAGGQGTRLRPALDKCQQLIYDKPLLYYLLTNVMKAGARDIFVSCNPLNISAAEALFKNADKEFGVNLTFSCEGREPGPAGVFIKPGVREFIGNEPVCITLDGIYNGGNFNQCMAEISGVSVGATVLAVQEPDPRPYGWFKMDEYQTVVDIIEKPKFTPEPNCLYLVQTGIYAYGPEVVDYAEKLELSKRGEYEVTDLHKLFLQEGKLTIQTLGHGKDGEFMWNDPGTPEKLLWLANKVQSIQKLTSCLVGSPHWQALKNCWVTADRLLEICTERQGAMYYDSLANAVSLVSEP